MTEEKKTKKFKMPEFNMWMGVSAALAILLVISVVNGGITGKSVANAPKSEVSGKVVDLLKLQDPNLNPQVLDVVENDSWYEVQLNIEGQTVPFHATKDGKYLIQVIGTFDEIREYLEFTAFMESQQGQEQLQQSGPAYYSEDLEDFVGCLAERGIKIYGANWCSHTSALVTNLGGYEAIAPIYIECVGQEQWCKDTEGVTGYPTVKMNGVNISPERTMNGFAQATGCVAPEVGIQQTTNPDAGC